ncbi:hypothetical protein AOLI_G00182020 [Acnodon oligacanthus]
MTGEEKFRLEVKVSRLDHSILCPAAPMGFALASVQCTPAAKLLLRLCSQASAPCHLDRCCPCGPSSNSFKNPAGGSLPSVLRAAESGSERGWGGFSVACSRESIYVCPKSLERLQGSVA